MASSICLPSLVAAPPRDDSSAERGRLGPVPARAHLLRAGFTMSTPASDPAEELVRRCLTGDERAFRELFLRYRQDVSRVVFRVMGPSPDLEDVVQEVFVHVYRSLRSFRGESRFSTWLHRLGVNVTLMHLRRARSRPRFSDVPVPDAPRDDQGDTPQRAAERAERVRALYRALETLSEKKRTVFVLHDVEGMPAKDVAEVVGAPVLTVRTRLFYARREVLAALSKEPCLEGVAEAMLADLAPNGGGARATQSEDAGVRPGERT